MAEPFGVMRNISQWIALLLFAALPSMASAIQPDAEYLAREKQFGKVPVRIGVEAHYSAIKPDDIVGSEWDFRLFIIPAAPAALFEWMQ
jgi:hypothetical protein